MRAHANWLLLGLYLAVVIAASPKASARITLNIVAFDNHDQIVGDLISQDFQISDQGKPHRIVSFHRNGDPQARLNDVSNARQVPPPVVILFDLLGDDLSNRGWGTEEIIRALEHLESSDSLYLYVLTNPGGLKPVRGLPVPQEDNPPEQTPWTLHIKPLLEIALGNAYGLTTVADPVPAIEALDAALKPFPGRKNLIWMAHSVPGDSREAADIATTLDRDGITLSSVNQGPFAGHDYLAELTGGTVYANDIKKAVREAMAASTSGYVMEYDGPPPDGKYHKIRVTCSRKRVRLQVKQGYYAN